MSTAHFHQAAHDWPDVGNDDIPCCMGSTLHGPVGCTCWQPVYDVAPRPPRRDEPTPTRPSLCHDCAYRPRSPERRGDLDVAADAAELERLAVTGTPFYCHDGMRRVVAWQHPSGARIDASALEYAPTVDGGRPYQADGTPALLCAGWAAMRRRSR